MAQRPQPQAPKGNGRHRAPAQPSTPVFPIRLAHLVRKLRNRHGRIEAPYALPHTFHQHLAISPLDFVRRLRKEEPRALQTCLRRCEDAWPKIGHGARNADDVTVLTYLVDSTWQAAGWTWHLRVPGLSPLSSRDEEDFRLHVHGSRQPFQASFPDWLAHTAQLIVDRVMVPRNVLPTRPLSLAIAVGEGRDMQGGYGAGVFLHKTLTEKRTSPGFQAGVRWLSTYSRTTESGAPPQDAAKYDGDHRTPRRKRPARSGRSLRSRRLDTPFRLFTSFDSGTFGG